MKHKSKRGTIIIVSTILVVLIMVSIGLLLQETANAVAPPPAVPQFEGEPYTAVTENPELLAKKAIQVAPLASGWTEVLSETFEAGIDSNIWTTYDDDGVTNGEYKWGSELVANTLNPASLRSAWAVGDGEQGGALDPSADGYPDNTDS
ncbi:MAG: hypothetical protein KAG66_22675, partial [Methylococcales bacterium]|nr:hypothetical protein [Methylococcales bacterium]